MSYLTNSDIEKRLGSQLYVELTDDAGTGSADPEKVEEARLGAEGEADSYLAGRYQTPVDVSATPSIAGVLKSFVLDIAVYRLHRRKPPVPADVSRSYVEAVTWLTRVSSAVAHLPLVSEAASSAQSAGPLREMTRAGLRDL